MKKILLLLFIFVPCFCHAQKYPAGCLAEDRIDASTHDTVKRGYWQVMERAGLKRKLNIFYRVSRISGNIILELKMMEGGSVFVVPRNAPLQLILENGSTVTLYNSAYKVSCIGCGARGYGGSGAQGVTLSFPVPEDDLHILLHNYIAATGISTGEHYIEAKINEVHSELFMDELKFITRIK